MKFNKERIKKLKEKLNIWCHKYYVIGEPSVSDEVFDASMFELLELEKKFPELKDGDSPTQRVGGKIVASIEKVEHRSRMLSLSNAFNIEDLEKFDQDIKKATNKNSIEYFVELKIDGLAVSVVYEKGILKYAATRGDGSFGEVITENIKKIYSVPLKINNDLDFFEIRGEVFMPKSEFKRINKERKISGEKLFVNPRNAAAGSLRTLDSKVSASRKLQAFLYWISNGLELGIEKQSQALEYLSNIKAKINKENIICPDIKSVIKRIEEIIENRNSFDYEIDGVVIKVNDFSYYPLIGKTVKHPKWEIAYKLPTEKVETVVLDIFPTIGRTGKITYNALLEPVRVAGTIVKYATLHNADFINEKDIRKGDFVIINKAGDIIPEVLKVVISKRQVTSVKWEETKNCPSCDFILIRKNDEVDQHCYNSECIEVKIQKLMYFTSKAGMNIVGFGERIVRTFFEISIIKDIKDIYIIQEKKNYIIILDNFGEKSFQNLIREIEVTKNNNLDKLLSALGIKHIGNKTSKIIAENFKTFENILNIKDISDISSIHEIGDKIAESLFIWIKQPENIELINFLREKGQNLEFISSKVYNSKITGKSFVITGILSKPRNWYKEMIESHGGVISSSVSSKTDYVLSGKNAGSKKTKAEALGLKIINEIELERMGNSNGI